METWTTIWVAAIVAVSTLCASFLPNWYLSKKAREDAQRQRKWEVRSKPLLKLRDELATMGVKLSRWTYVAYRKESFKARNPPEDLEKQLQDAESNWNAYWASETLSQILNQQCDPELIKLVEDIMNDYQLSYSIAEHRTQWSEAAFSRGADILEKNKARIIEAQSLINKKLEEL